MFDVLVFPDPAPATLSADRVWTSLRAKLSVGPGDETELVCSGLIVDRLGRRRRCAWHLVLHRPVVGDTWTHLYRVVPDNGGRVLALLDQARAGNRWDELRGHALRMARRDGLAA